MKNLSLNAKFIVILSIFILTAFGVSILGIQKLGELNASVNQIVVRNVPVVVGAQRLKGIANEIKNQEKVLILEKEMEKKTRVGERLLSLEAEAVQLIQDVRKLLVFEESRAVLSSTEDLLKKWRSLSDRMRSLALADKNDEASFIALGETAISWKIFLNRSIR